LFPNRQKTRRIKTENFSTQRLSAEWRELAGTVVSCADEMHKLRCKTNPGGRKWGASHKPGSVMDSHSSRTRVATYL